MTQTYDTNIYQSSPPLLLKWIYNLCSIFILHKLNTPKTFTVLTNFRFSQRYLKEIVIWKNFEHTILDFGFSYKFILYAKDALTQNGANVYYILKL